MRGAVRVASHGSAAVASRRIREARVVVFAVLLACLSYSTRRSLSETRRGMAGREGIVRARNTHLARRGHPPPETRGRRGTELRERRRRRGRSRVRFRVCGRPSREPLPRASATPPQDAARKRSTCLRALASVWLKRVVLSRKACARARRRRRARLQQPADRGSAAEMILSLMKCSPTKGSARFRENPVQVAQNLFPHTGAHTFFSHGVPQRRPDQGPDVSFETKISSAPATLRNPTSSIGPGAHSSDTRTARVEE